MKNINLFKKAFIFKSDKGCQHLQRKTKAYPYYQDGDVVFICENCLKSNPFTMLHGRLSKKVYFGPTDAKLAYSVLGFGLYTFAGSQYGNPDFIMRSPHESTLTVDEYTSSFNTLIKDCIPSVPVEVLEETTFTVRAGETIRDYKLTLCTDEEQLTDFKGLHGFRKPGNPVYFIELAD